MKKKQNETKSRLLVKEHVEEKCYIDIEYDHFAKILYYANEYLEQKGKKFDFDFCLVEELKNSSYMKISIGKRENEKKQ